MPSPKYIVSFSIAIIFIRLVALVELHVGLSDDIIYDKKKNIAIY